MRIAVCLFVFTVVGLVLGEAAMSLYFKARNPESNFMIVEDFGSPYVFKAKPQSGWSEGGIEYRQNNYGMRRNEDVAETPEDGVTRILSYGDSISNGWGVPFGETYSHRLESALGQMGSRRYEVLNMYRGVSPTIASFHIRRDVRQFRPHGVIIEIELLNDISDEAHVHTDGRDENGLPVEVCRARYVLCWNGQLLNSLPLAGSFIERTITWSLVSQTLGSLMSLTMRSALDDPTVFYYYLGFDRFLLTQETLARGFEQTFVSLRGIHRFLEGRDVRFLLVILPSKHAYSEGRYRENAFEQVRIAETGARDMNIPFISLYDAFQTMGGEELFIDFCHPTGEGNRVIAHEILHAVKEW